MMQLCGVDLHPCLSGAAWLPAYGALLVADLHLEKGSSRAHRGVHLPPYDTRAGLAALEAAIARWRPERVILLGDSFHDDGGPGRMDAGDRAMLSAIGAQTELTWISGNHDPELPRDLPGHHARELALGPLTLRHEPTVKAAGEIAGHLHPAAAIVRRGRKVRAKCFVLSPNRLILPAFGAYTGGLDVRHEAFRPLLPGDAFRVVMVGRSSLHVLPGRAVL
jgi:DNA ligase-associated metallophosphoesterase